MRDALTLRGQTSNIGFVWIADTASSTGGGKTGLTSASGGLLISVRRELASTMTAYSGANIGAVSTLGTWANPGTGKVNIKEVDATNAPGLYELHFENAVYSASDASRKVVGMVQVTGGAPTPFEMPLAAVDAQDSFLGFAAVALPSAPVANTVGEALFIADNLVGRIGTAQAGASTTITLDSGASSTDGRYVGYGVYLYGGTGGGIRGVGQERTITAYVGSTKVATVAQAWGTTPDNTSKYMLYVQPWVNVGAWNGTAVGASLTAGYPCVEIKTGSFGTSTWAAGAINASAIANNAFTSSVLAASYKTAIAAAIWQDATAGDFTVTGSIGKALFINDVAPGGVGGHAIVGSAMTLSGDFSATMKTSIGTAVAASAVASVTGDIGGKVVGGGSTTITGTGARVVDASGNAIATAASLTTAAADAHTAATAAKLDPVQNFANATANPTSNPAVIHSPTIVQRNVSITD